MKRPSYLQQIVPSRRGAGMPALAPPRLLFRPDPLAAAAFVETLDTTVPGTAPSSRPPAAGRHGVAVTGQQTITAPPVRSIDETTPARRPRMDPDQPAPRQTFPATPRPAAPVLAPPSRSAIETAPPPRIASTGQVSQSIRQVSTRTVEAPVTPRTPAAPDLSPAPITPPRDRIVETVSTLAAPIPEPKARGQAQPQAALPLLMPPPQPAPHRPVQARTPPPPSFHIGTLEVNVLPPAPIPQPTAAARPQPRAVRTQPAAGRLARGFGVFGLSQS
jgi:hypothetical protein